MDFDSPFEILSDHDQKCLESLSRSIIHSLRQVKSKPLDQLYIKDMLILLEIETRLRKLDIEEAAKDSEWHFFQSIATETKEFILMHETEEERKTNKRPLKNDFSKDFCYLSEAFELFLYIFKQHYIKVETEHPDVPPFILDMQIIQDISMHKPVKIPSMRKIRIINKHKIDLEKHINNISEKYTLLPESLQSKVEKFDFFLFSLWGKQSIDSAWSQAPCLSERTDLNLMGKLSREEHRRVILEGFPDNDALSEYILSIQEFLFEAEATEDFMGSKTMFVSLFYYLLKNDLASNYQAFNKLANANKIFSIFSNCSKYEG